MFLHLVLVGFRGSSPSARTVPPAFIHGLSCVYSCDVDTRPNPKTNSKREARRKQKHRCKTQARTQARLQRSSSNRQGAPRDTRITQIISLYNPVQSSSCMNTQNTTGIALQSSVFGCSLKPIQISNWHVPALLPFHAFSSLTPASCRLACTTRRYPSCALLSTSPRSSWPARGRAA